MAESYQIANWDAHFETDETRKRESLRWVPMPNKHDGLGFRMVAAQRNAAELYAAWVLMLQLASKGRRGGRGLLARDGAPLTSEDMALMTGFPQAGFDKALQFFSQAKVGWIIAIYTPETPTGSAVGDTPKGQHSSVPTARSAGVPADDAVRPGLNRREGIEGKEEKGIFCAEPEEPASAPEPVMEFPCVGKPKSWALMPNKLSAWEEAFPDMDVHAACVAARLWCENSTSRRKTANGMPRFLNGWISRAQNHGEHRQARDERVFYVSPHPDAQRPFGDLLRSDFNHSWGAKAAAGDDQARALLGILNRHEMPARK